MGWPWSKKTAEAPAEDLGKMQEQCGNELYTFLSEKLKGTQIQLSSMPKNGKDYSIIGGVPQNGTMYGNNKITAPFQISISLSKKGHELHYAGPGYNAKVIRVEYTPANFQTFKDTVLAQIKQDFNIKN